MNISGPISQRIGNSFDSASPDSNTQNKTRDEWRKVLGTFDLIKDKSPSIKRKVSKQQSARKKLRLIKEKPFIISPSRRRCILSSSFTNIINENDRSIDLDDSEIVWSSSNEESDVDSNPISKSQTINSKRGHHLQPEHLETEISWSSSNESDSEEPPRNTLVGFQKKTDSEYELNLFVREIEKDLRRSKKIKHNMSKKGGYADSFLKAVNKAKTDVGFLNYEHSAGIISGVKGVITEKKTSYGASMANVRFENGDECCVLLGKHMQSESGGSNVVCFFDYMNCFLLNRSRNVYIQPNKLIKA